MCAACELGFWMAMDEEPAEKPKRTRVRKAKGEMKVEAVACDVPAGESQRRKRKAGRSNKVSVARD